jgi:N-acetylmuramoyl-L-alanine amidase
LLRCFNRSHSDQVRHHSQEVFRMRLMRRLIVFVLAVALMASYTEGQARVSAANTPGNSKQKVSIFIHDLTGQLVEYAVPAPQAGSDLEAALAALLTQDLPPELWREIPAGTRLKSVRLNGGTAHIDLSREFLDNMTNNTSVRFILESLLYTAYQFPQVSSVIITVEGKAPGYKNGQDLGGPFYRNQMPAPAPEAARLGAAVDPLSLIAPAPKVFIDPGHGGNDPGAVASDGTEEEDIVLDVGLRLKSYIEGNNGYANMSRTTDTYVRYCSTDPNGSGSTRAQLANSWGADIFISIHANSAGTSSARGHEDYYAANHDAASSQDLANRIFNFFALRYPVRSVKSNADPGAGYCVLKETNMTAVLTELLFMSNSQDLALLKDPNERDWMAYYLFRGIKDYWCQGQSCTWEK